MRRLKIRMVMLGNAGCGKSCLRRRFAEDVYCENTSSCDGNDRSDVNIDVGGTQMSLEIRDSAGTVSD